MDSVNWGSGGGCPNLAFQERKRHININKFFFVTDRVARGLPTGWPGVSRPVARGQKKKVYVLCAEPKEHKHFRPGSRPGGFGCPAGRIRVPGREDR